MDLHDDEPRDAVFDTLWERAHAAWDDEKAHQAVLDYAIRSERLADLAGRYRALSEDPEKAERAKKKLALVVVAATQLLHSMKTPPQIGIPLPITLSAAAICIAIVGWVAMAVLRR